MPQKNASATTYSKLVGEHPALANRLDRETVIQERPFDLTILHFAPADTEAMNRTETQEMWLFEGNEWVELKKGLFADAATVEPSEAFGAQLAALAKPLPRLWWKRALVVLQVTGQYEGQVYFRQIVYNSAQGLLPAWCAWEEKGRDPQRALLDVLRGIPGIAD